MTQPPNASQVRKQREKETRRQDMLKTGLKLFSKHGYASISMDQIALEAEVTKPTLYSYFGSKAELYSTIVLEMGFGHFESAFRGCLNAKESPVVEFKNLRKVFKEFCLGRPRQVFLLFLNLTRPEIIQELSKPIQAEIQARLDLCLGIIEQVLKRGIKEGCFRPVNVEEKTYALWALGIGLAQMRDSQNILGNAKNTEGLYDQITENLFQSIMA